MIQVKVALEVITSMFSAGENVKKAEFRVTELKALLRSTFREFFKYESLDDLKNKEEVLFGSTNKKSPVTMRVGKNSYFKPENEKLHKNLNAQAIPRGTKIDVIFQSREEKYLQIYLVILKLASITGALGKRSRKGMGAFKIVDISNEIIDVNKSFEYLLNGFEEKLGGKTYNIELRKVAIEKERDSDSYIKYKILHNSNMIDIHYVKYLHKISLGTFKKEESDAKINDILRKISTLTSIRLSESRNFLSDEVNKKLKDKDLELIFNKEILGNYNYKIGKEIIRSLLGRFASPIYITIYQETHENGVKNYLIIKEINYNYVYKEILKKKAKEIKSSNNNDKEILDQMKSNDSDYIQNYVNKIIEVCGVKQ